MSVDVCSVEAVSEREMAIAFEQWADRPDMKDGLDEQLEFLVELQDRINAGQAIRLGYSVIDKAVGVDSIKTLSEEGSEVKRGLADTNCGSIIIGSETRIDPDTKIKGRVMIVNSQLLSTPGSARSNNIPTSLLGTCLVENSEIIASTIDRSSVNDTDLVHSTVDGNSILTLCNLRNSFLRDARFREVNGTTGGAVISGDMEGMNLACVNAHSNGRSVIATPKADHSRR